MDNEAKLKIEVDPRSFPPKGWIVKRAILHGSVPLPNGGGETESLYSTPQTGVGRSATTGVHMTYTHEGLFCEYKGSGFIIPLANIKGCWF